jgi:hypothetical protein
MWLGSYRDAFSALPSVARCREGLQRPETSVVVVREEGPRERQDHLGKHLEHLSAHPPLVIGGASSILRRPSLPNPHRNWRGPPHMFGYPPD